MIFGVQKILTGYEEISWDIAEHRNIDKLKEELLSYYNDEFLVNYKNVNNGLEIDVNELINKLSPEAVMMQHAYIYDNPAPLGSKHEYLSSSMNSTYDKAHTLVHPSLRQFLEAFGYYDIFLVDSKKGRVIYSVYKELDYATNLLSGPYADTGLAEVFRQANKLTSKDEFVLLDYAQYSPSYEAPASFIASPIYDGNEKVGVLIFQMPLEKISSIMNARSGMGETGEAYLVGSDGLLRSDSYKNILKNFLS